MSHYSPPDAGAVDSAPPAPASPPAAPTGPSYPNDGPGRPAPALDQPTPEVIADRRPISPGQRGVPDVPLQAARHRRPHDAADLLHGMYEVEQ